MLLLGCGIYIALPGSGVRPTQGTLVRYIEVLASQWKATPLDAPTPARPEPGPTPALAHGDFRTPRRGTIMR